MKKLVGVLLTAFTSACSSMAVNKDIPALIVDPNQASRSELMQVVSTALSVPDITLAADALTQDSSLLIERKTRQTLESSRLMGRDMGKPETFRLVISGSKCVLVHQKNGKRWTLKNSRCEAEKK